MILEIINPQDLPREDIEYLRKQKVEMDDFDYIVVVPDSYSRSFYKLSKEENGCSRGTHAPTCFGDRSYYALEFILQGCCHNAWYKCKFRENKVFVGVAYHS